jgi:hypothetical protein
MERQISRRVGRPRIRRYLIVRAIVDHQLAVMLAAVLGGLPLGEEIVGHAIRPWKFRDFVQPCVALLLNYDGSVLQPPYSSIPLNAKHRDVGIINSFPQRPKHSRQIIAGALLDHGSGGG